jgi:hypothetical protein
MCLSDKVAKKTAFIFVSLPVSSDITISHAHFHSANHRTRCD